MRFPIKLAVGSAVAFFFIIMVGFILFPKMIKGKIKAMVNLAPGTEIRGMFTNVPFGLDFNIYIFSVLNPDEVQNGGIPKLKEFGPFCYEEWKTKIDIEDNDVDDTMTYSPVDTFLIGHRPGCVNLDTEVTIPHPMILGMINAITRQKPGALTLANKAIKSIWSNPTSLFITVKARELLFDGVVIHCGVTDFAGKAICTNLKSEPSLVHLNENDLAFSLIGPKNGTPGKRITALRGTRDYHDVGRIVTCDGKSKMSVWNGSKCDAILGTDGTVFPPMLKREEGLASFAPDLCRSLAAEFTHTEKYDGIPVSSYSAHLGDQSNNPDEKCFCTTPDTCLKRGLMDLYKCAQVPIYVSHPHFYDCHESYLKAVKGLKPNMEKHAIKILFEPENLVYHTLIKHFCQGPDKVIYSFFWYTAALTLPHYDELLNSVKNRVNYGLPNTPKDYSHLELETTGGPVWAKKRLQFNMPLEPNQKVELFHNFTPTVFPLFWVEEGIALNNTFTKPIKDFFTIQKIVSVVKYVVLLASLAGFAAAAYFYYKEDDSLKISSVNQVKPTGNKSAISTVFNADELGQKVNMGNLEKY